MSATRKKIAIDMIFFSGTYSGITRVWETLLLHLDKKALENDIILLIRGKDIPALIKQSRIHEKYQYILINDFAYPIMMQDVDYLNNICTAHSFDYFISTYFTFCTVIPNIQLIHDMIPEIFNMATTHMWQQKDLAIRNATQFITISNTSKQDLIKYYPHIEKEKYSINIIHNTIATTTSNNTTSNNTTSNNLEYDNEFIQNVLIKNGIQPKKYIFTISTNDEPYKNQQLIKQFLDKYMNQLQTLLNTKYPVIILKKGIPSGGVINGGILFLTNVPEKILNTLYHNALCYINPSLYEGFCLPVFEAFTHSTPVISCNMPVLNELCQGCINYIENDPDDLWEKVKNISKDSNNVLKKIEHGKNILTQYTLEKHIKQYTNLFNNLGHTQSHDNHDNQDNKFNAFFNIILQSYNETIPARRAELEYCILANLENPYVKYIHDFGINSGLPDTISKHPKYIRVDTSISLNGKWLSYSRAFNYSNDNYGKYGHYWGIINCDIFLDQDSKWLLSRGWLNREIILAQSRHEFLALDKTPAMDTQFSKTLHANTQDAWFYMAPIKVVDCDFELGILGCDNAIADRFIRSGYNVINKPQTWKIMHYDNARGKNSSNFIVKHIEDQKNKKDKPKSSFPEEKGQYLVPNYDSLLGNNGNIDIVAIINQLGGISNLEKYKLICEMFSNRIIIHNR